MAEELPIDRRQRLAAAQILAALDFPQPAMAWAAHMVEASKLCPGVKMNEIICGDRLAGLKRARALIDEMMGEI